MELHHPDLVSARDHFLNEQADLGKTAAHDFTFRLLNAIVGAQHRSSDFVEAGRNRLKLRPLEAKDRLHTILQDDLLFRDQSGNELSPLATPPDWEDLLQELDVLATKYKDLLDQQEGLSRLPLAME